MEVSIWSELQVQKCLIMHNNAGLVTCARNRKITPATIKLKNENGKIFECVCDLQGTIPGTATLNLMTQLSECTTNLNEIESEDMIIENNANRAIRMVINY